MYETPQNVHKRQSRFIHTGRVNVESDMSSEPPTIKKRFLKERESTVLSNNYQAGFTLMKCFLSVGVLALPYSFSQVGIGLGVLGVLVIGLISNYCLNLMISVADDIGAVRLEVIAYEVLGKWGMYSVEISVCLHQMGSCIAALIFATKFLNYLVCNLGIASLCNNIPFEVLTSLIVITPLTLINDIHYLYIPNLASIVLSIFGFSAQMIFNIETIQMSSKRETSIMDTLMEFRFENLPLFLGTVVYVFEAVGTFFNIRASMINPLDFPKLLKYEIFAIVIFDIVFGSTCYLALGKSVPGIIIFSLPTKSFYLWIVGAYAVSVLLVYPLRLFPLLKIVENSNYLKPRIFDSKLETKNPLLRYGLRFILTIFMLMVVYTAKSFNLFLSFLGSFVSTYLAFLLPILLYNAHFERQISKKRKWFNLVTFAVGLLMGITGIYDSVKDMISYKH